MGGGGGGGGGGGPWTGAYANDAVCGACVGACVWFVTVLLPTLLRRPYFGVVVKALAAVWAVAFAATVITTVPRAGSPWHGKPSILFLCLNPSHVHTRHIYARLTSSAFFLFFLALACGHQRKKHVFFASFTF